MVVRLLIGSAVSLIALGGLFVIVMPDNHPSLPDATIVVGERIYQERCASCHGGKLEGQPNWRQRRSDGKMPAPPHDASGHTWHHSDAVLFEITKYGPGRISPGYQSDMPAFEGTLSDQEIDLVLRFIRSTWPIDIQEKQRLMKK